MLPVGTSLAEDVSEDSSIEESVDSAESVMSFPLRWEQSERTSQYASHSWRRSYKEVEEAFF